MRIVPAFVLALLLCMSCNTSDKDNSIVPKKKMTAKEILSNPSYLAISYGGYRDTTRTVQPTIIQLKQDLKIMHAMGIRILRTYNMQLPHAVNVVKAIHELQNEDSNFEMYVMLGAWIDCKNAWTGLPVDHYVESDKNAAEIERAVTLAKQYPDIIKIIAVGNEAMVKWATSYYVQPDVILKWVSHLQNLKKKGDLHKDLWITSSDNFASWGGGDSEYHVPALNELIKAVDYLSVHTYPMHDTHYNPVFWGIEEQQKDQPKEKQIEAAMKRSLDYAKSQYDSVVNYMNYIGVKKPVHIGETGWATASNGLYGNNGSKATDEYKSGIYYQLMRDWTQKNQIACFYFEAFDEQWKDAGNPHGSENHFGLFTIDGKAKYAIWDKADQGVFKELQRDGNAIQKTFDGDKNALLETVSAPPVKELQL